MLGASAGGLNPTTRLLAGIPPDTGMAFVVIEHLDPAHKSQLPEILGRATSMPVHEAAGGVLLEADHVYVITPNVFLGIDGGRLRLHPRPVILPHLPIDFFCLQLAADRGARSIGVILSGTGSDGTLGLKAIKGEGGITFAQDDTAEHGGMPRSAVGAGVVDFVLSPEAIAAELVRLASHPYLREEPAGERPVPEPNADPFAPLFRLLLAATRVDYANYKRSTVERRIARRMVVNRKDRVEDYVTFAREHPAEIQALHQDLSINVTRFFRDPGVFEALQKTVFPRLAAEHSAEKPIRIWVPGCATGEEPYSIAIGLIELLESVPSAIPIRIFATDVSETALARARAGTFLENIVADVSAGRLDRFFVRSSGGYTIKKTIREMCVFARHDMTRDPPFSNIDLVSCRNVLIYLGPLLQRRVFGLFHYALAPGGTLVLGSSEAPGDLSDHFEVVDGPNRIYRAKDGAKRFAFDFSSGGEYFSDLTPPAPVGSEPAVGKDLLREADRVVAAKYAPPGVVVDEAMTILQFRGQTAPFLAPAPGAASLNVLKMAREGLLADLKGALEESRETGGPARRDGVLVVTEGHELTTSVQVVPMDVAGRRNYAVLFERAGDEVEAPVTRPAATPGAGETPSERDRVVEQLRRELAATREHLQTSVQALEQSNEELATTNEEAVSNNEELQSTNEELQTAKEELQASNEELNTVNEELRLRNLEATRLGEDLTTLLRSISIPIVNVGPDLRIRRFTPSAGEILNLIESDVGRPISDIASKLAGVPLAALMAKVLETLAPLEREAVDEKGCWHKLSFRPYRTTDNKIDGVVLTVVNVDAIKKAAEELRAARNDAETILGAAHVPLVVLDAGHRIVAANASFLRFFRLPPPEGASGFVRKAGDRRWNVPALAMLLDEASPAGGAAENVVVRRDLPGLGYRAVALSVKPLTLGSSGDPLVLLSIEDVTEHERAMKILREEQSHETQRLEAIGRLAGGVAHDFNNLLTIVTGYGETLLGTLPPESPDREMVREILHASGRAAALTHQLLAYGRKQVLAPRDVDLNDLIRGMTKLLNPLLGEGVVLHVTLSPEPARVRIDASQMEQVLMNLCINARDAIGGNGNVHVTTSIEEPALPDGSAGLAAARAVRLAVRDDGCGMNAETAEHVFEPFFTTKAFGKGSGLGLATVYGIVKQHGGQVEVTSRLGGGSEFRVLLPLVAGAAPAAPRAGPRTSRQTILLVEDEEAVRRLVHNFLTGLGFEVLDASNGAEALRLAAAFDGRVDLLLTDVVMPEMGGPELAGALTSVRPDLEVLFVSGHVDESALSGVHTAGRKRLLRKPFSLSKLEEEVRALLPKPA